MQDFLGFSHRIFLGTFPGAKKKQETHKQHFHGIVPGLSSQDKAPSKPRPISGKIRAVYVYCFLFVPCFSRKQSEKNRGLENRMHKNVLPKPGHKKTMQLKRRRPDQWAASEVSGHIKGACNNALLRRRNGFGSFFAMLSIIREGRTSAMAVRRGSYKSAFF